MNDVFEKFQEQRSGKLERKPYTAAELLYIVKARSLKTPKSVQEIGDVLDRTKNSVRYVLNVILPGPNKKTVPKVKTVADIFTFTGEEIPKGIGIEDHANTILTSFETSNSIILE